MSLLPHQNPNSRILKPNEFGYSDVTLKGEALVHAWCDTPAPVMRWVDPRFDTVVGGEA